MEFADYIPTPKVEGVWYYDGRQKAVCGTLCLTGHHMIFYADTESFGEVWILYKNIDAVEKRLGVDKGTLILKCKDLRQIQITIPGVEDATNIASTAEVLSSITEARLLYPFFYRPKFEFDEDGWMLYRLDEHFTELSSKTDKWRITEANSDFSLCSSYPSRVIVPASMDDASIRKSAKFRHGGRFPVLSYFHKNGTCIARCSQPMLGTGNRRCKDDEKLINSMLGSSHRGYVLDVRSSNAAMQARTKGGGFESEHHYPRWKRIHMNLHSFFVQQESLIRVVEASNDKSGSMDRWISKLESCNWMEYVKKALEASCLVAQCVDREEWSVLVHGGEGLDSTLTVTSLAQVILDPDCRTIRGFLALIEREWIQGGHPFADRSLHSAYSNGKQHSEGPVFAIFLECIYQLLWQFPLSFEFTSTLLVDLRTHCYASQFGTFFFNNMQERIRGKLQSKTVSLWTYLLSPSVFIKYINPLYRRKGDIIWPSVAPQSLEFWEELFTPWLAPNQFVWDRVLHLEAEREELKSLVSVLSKRVGKLEGASSGVDFQGNDGKEGQQMPKTLSPDDGKHKYEGLESPLKKPMLNGVVNEDFASTKHFPDSNMPVTVPSDIVQSSSLQSLEEVSSTSVEKSYVGDSTSKEDSPPEEVCDLIDFKDIEKDTRNAASELEAQDT